MSYEGSPVAGVAACCVAREEPVMACKVHRGILKLTVFGFVGFFQDLSTRGFGVLVVAFDVFQEDREALRAGPELDRRRAASSCAFEHNKGAAQIYLRAAGFPGRPIAVVLAKAKGLREPGDRIFNTFINDVRQNGIYGY